MVAARASAALSGATVGQTGEQPRAHLVVQGAGPPVLFLHGWGTSSKLFEPVLGPLARERMLLVPDLPGFGDTPEPPLPWGVDDYAAWTLALLDRLGIDRCDIVGHSNGGRIAIVIAAGHPERVDRLVLTASAGIRSPQSLRARVRTRSYKVLRRAQETRLLPEPMRAAARRRADRRGSDDYRAASGVMRGTLVRLVNQDLRELLPQVAASTLLVWGSEDDATPLPDARLMERLIPDAGLVVFEGAGHYAYLEQSARFVRIVDVFLRRRR